MSLRKAILVLLVFAGTVRADGVLVGPRGTLTGVTAGNGLAGGGTSGNVTVSLSPCSSSGQTWIWNGSAFACSTAGGGLSGLTTGDLLVATSPSTAGNYAGSDPGACSAGQADTHPALSVSGVLTKSCSTFFDTLGTGLTTGANAHTVKLADTAVTPGSYTYASFTVDQQGRLTLASSGTAPVTSVGVTAPIASTGGTTPTLSLNIGNGLTTSGGNLVANLGTGLTFVTGAITTNLAGGTCSGGTPVATALSATGTLTCSSLASVGAGTSNLTNSAGANVIPKSNGTNLVASSLSDNGTTVSTAEQVAITLSTGETLKLNDDSNSTTAANQGMTWNSNRSGASYFWDTKLATGGTLFGRIGAGTSAGSTNQWLGVDGSGNVTLPKNLAVNGNTTLGDATSDTATVNGQATLNANVGATFGLGADNLSLIDVTSAAQGVGGGIQISGAYNGGAVTAAAEIKAMKSNSVAGDFGFDLALGTRLNGGGLQRNLLIESTGTTAMLGQGAAVGGLYQGQVQDVADVFNAGLIRKNLDFYSDDLETGTFVKDSTWGPVNNTSTTTYTTSTAVAAPWSPSTITPAGGGIGKLTCANGASNCSAYGSFHQFAATSTTTGITDLRSKTATFSVWIQSASGTMSAVKIELARSAFNDGSSVVCPSTTAGTWVRCSITVTFNATSFSDNSELDAFVAVGQAASLYVAGAQIELGSVPTTYEPTWQHVSRGAELFVGLTPIVSFSFPSYSTGSGTSGDASQGAWAYSLGVGGEGKEDPANGGLAIAHDGTLYTTSGLVSNGTHGGLWIGNGTTINASIAASGTVSDTGEYFATAGTISYTGLTNTGVLYYDTTGHNLTLAAQFSTGTPHILLAASNSGNAATVLDVSAGNVSITGTMTASSWIKGTVLYANSGGATGPYMDTGSYACDNLTNSSSTCKFGAVGFASGTTQFRSLEIDDGKGNAIATFKGQASPALDLASHPIQSVADPTNAQDAATKNYVDTKAGLLIGIQRFAASGTYTPTSGTKKVWLRMCGAGGGGGGAKGGSSLAGVGAGGAAGAYFEKYIDCAGSCTGSTITDGTAGAAGANTPAGGGAGGDTTAIVNGTTYTAKGGGGGGASAAGISAGFALGGAPVTGSSSGDIVSDSMENGQDGIVLSGTVLASGAGGSSNYGAGGKGQINASAAGFAATGFCAGGGGGIANTVTGQTGGAGTAGYVEVFEYR